MKYKSLSLLIISIIALSIIPLGLLTFVVAEPSTGLPDYEPIDIGVELRNKTPNIYLGTFEDHSSTGLRSSDSALDWLFMLRYDDTAPGGYTLFTAWFQRVLIGAYCEIWVLSDYDTGEFILDYPEGDSRNPVIITMEQLEYLAKEFDTTIYPTTTSYFGKEDFHNGLNAEFDDLIGAPEDYYYDPVGKTMIMISNIRDEAYYDETYPNYIAGFYWGTFEYYFDRNIINIDAYDFVHRVGEDNNPDCPWWVPDDDKNRPNLYESLIAHEYQHLIHADWCWWDESYMNEACSLFAEPLCGYEFDFGQVNWFLATPDNSLTYWGEQSGENILADYGSSFLWALYLTDHYGFDFLRRYVLANWYQVDGDWYFDPYFPTESKERITELLPDDIDFYDVYHDWRLANLIHSDYYGHDRYNYHLEELRAYTGNANHIINWDDLTPLEVLHVKGMTNKWTSAEEKFGETLSLEDPPDAKFGWPTGYFKLAPFATDYIQFDSLRGLSIIQFLGDDEAIYGWTYDEDLGAWWSGSADEINTLLTTEEFNVESTNILTIDTYWDIEDYWDFGFTQISTDGGETWVSMEDVDVTTTYIIDPDGYPGFEEMLPGLTGYSGDWITLTFDLSNYLSEGDESYIIGFRYATDWAYHYGGWYIREVLINGAPVGELNPTYPHAKFMVTVVQVTETRRGPKYCIHDMFICDSMNYGLDLAYLSKNQNYILVVSTIMDDGYTDYKFKARSWGLHRGWFK